MQAIIKLIEKKNRDKRYIKNWRHISLINVDTKILSKAFSKKLKDALPWLIYAQHTAYVQNRNIDESGRLISGNIDINNIRPIESFLVTMDVEKTFDPLDHKVLLINFGAWYLFLLIKEKPRIKELNIFYQWYLYSVYADDTTFFIKDINSIKEMVNRFHIFSRFSGLRANLSKFEIAGIGVLKGVKVAVCGLQCAELVLDTMKILGTHFSYNEKLKKERNICLILANIQRSL